MLIDVCLDMHTATYVHKGEGTHIDASVDMCINTGIIVQNLGAAASCESHVASRVALQ